MSERLDAGRALRTNGSPAVTDAGTVRLREWASQVPFDRADWFARRLAFDGTSEAELATVLSEHRVALRRRFAFSPDWVVQLEDALDSPETDEPLSIPDRLRQRPEHGFLLIAAPFLRGAMADVDAGAAAIATRYPACPFRPSAIGGLFADALGRTLLDIVTRTLVHELHAARVRGDLRGETSAERFQDFIADLSTPDRVQQLLARYPVMARLLAQETERWVTVTLTVAERLAGDWPQLREWHEGDPGLLCGVRTRVADPHRGGHSVVIATFDSGLRLVYKAKALAVDAQFQRLLAWLNDRGQTPPFPVMRVLDRGAYGWVTHVAPAECTTADEVRRFHLQQGAYLAVLHALDATDFHAGNVIAAGEAPLLIDLEGLFQPRRASSRGDTQPTADALARRLMSHSVLHVGLLPERIRTRTDVQGLDRTGLGSPDGHMTPNGSPPGWEAPGTDEMRLVRQRRTVTPPSRSRPRLNGQPVDVLTQRATIVEGFHDTYARLLRHRQALLAPGGPVSWFGACDVSVFLRSSRTYRRLLRESYRPEILRDGLERDRHFDRLWVEIADDEGLLDVLRAERDDLYQGDVPIFTSRPDSCDLWTSHGERLAGFFPQSSTHIVRRRLAGLGTEDCGRQTWFIEASLATLLGDDWRAAPRPQPPGEVTADSALMGVATAVGDRLCELAVRGPDDAAWLGLFKRKGRPWSIEPLGTDLHNGLPGVALFLAHLAAVTGRDRYDALARAAWRTCSRQCRAGHGPDEAGAFNGWSGLVYTLAHLAVLWNEPDLINEASTMALRLHNLVDDADASVFTGLAGCVGALHALDCAAPGTDGRPLGIRCGERLVERIVTRELGDVTAVPDGAFKAGAGHFHGLAGVVSALLTLDQWSGDGAFGAMARSLMRDDTYAASFEPSRSGGWAWLAALASHDAPEARIHAMAAFDAALATGFGRHHALGHGDSGALAFMQRAAHLLGDGWQVRVRLAAGSMIASIDRDGWRGHVPFALETPGLMSGLAGIGYQCLRLAAPERVPCLVTLEPPRFWSRPAAAAVVIRDEV